MDELRSMNTAARRLLWLILAIALISRVIFGLSRPVTITENTGSDSYWYWVNAHILLSGATIAEVDGAVYDVSQLQPPPLYLIFIGAPQFIMSESAAFYAVLLTQAILSTLTVYMAAELARRISGRDSAALITAALIGLSPAFIIESGQITTETLFMTLLTGGLLAYVMALDQPARRTGFFLLGAVLLGLATLTRAVLLMFPLALAGYWVFAQWRRDHWRAVGRALAYFAVYLALVLTWTAYNLIRWDRFVIAGEGLAAFLYIGATGWDDPHALDQRLLDSGAEQEGTGEFSQNTYTGAAANAITADPMGYVGRRFGELAGAFLQPHGTAYFPGEGLRELAVTWARDDRSLEGLIDVVRGDQFAIKALEYVFHYGTIVLGVIGAWRLRSRWRLILPLIGYIAYTLLVHLALLAIPRYLFPTLIVWAALAGGVTFRRRT